MNYMTDQLRQLFLEGFDYTSDRLKKRLSGMTDEEYFWEPVPNCMSIRREGDALILDTRLPANEPNPPFTTIAWRLAHISGEVLIGSTTAIVSGRPSKFQQLMWPGKAREALEFLSQAYMGWRTSLESLSDEALHARLGPNWGPYAEDSMAGLVLHIFDEFVHHGAEVGVLRDLYSCRFKSA